MPKPKPPILIDFDARMASLPGYRTRAMFGGYGLYLGDQIFGLLADGKFYFHVDDETQSAYEAEEMTPFEYSPGQIMKSYYEVPRRVLADDVLLGEWATRAAMRPEKNSKKKRKSQ